MRLLADENMPGPVVDALRDSGHEVVWIFEGERGSSDLAVVARARAEDRLLITFDTDFGEIIFCDRVPPPSGVILLRLPATLDWDLMARIVLAALATPVEWRGSFSVIDQRHVRVSALPEAKL